MSARALRRTSREVEAQSRLTAAGGLVRTQTAGGDVVRDPRFQEIIIRIIAPVGDGYSFQQVYSDYDPATNTISYPDHLEGLATDGTDLLAFEVNLNQVIAPGTRAFATLSDDGEALIVERCCGIPFASGSGAGGLVITACCPNGLETELTATFSVTAGSCACIVGSIPITYDGDAWEGTDELCGVTVSVRMYCVDVHPGSQVMYLDVTIGGYTVTQAAEFHGGESCDPLTIGVSFQALDGGSAAQQSFFDLCGANATINLAVTS